MQLFASKLSALAAVLSMAVLAVVASPVQADLTVSTPAIVAQSFSYLFLFMLSSASLIIIKLGTHPLNGTFWTDAARGLRPVTAKSYAALTSLP